MRDPLYLYIIPAVAGTAILSALIVPFYWHPTTVVVPATIEKLRWPDESLRPPSPVVLSEENFTPPPSHSVKTDRYVLNSTKEKTTATEAPIAESDVCKRDGGYKITVHHGRGWRCRYPSSATRSSRRRR